MSPEDWLKLGQRLHALEHGHQWWIGDWANYGEGRGNKQEAERMPFKFQTVRVCAYVARRFPVLTRINVLVNHHRVVASQTLRR